MTFEEIIQEEKKLSFDDGVKQGISRGFNDGISKGREEGISQGFRDGISKGREEGISQGISQGEKQGAERKARETAETLLKMGLTVEQITFATGLSVHEINQLSGQ